MTQTQKTLFWLFLTAGLVFAVFVLKDVLLPFVAGFIVAYFLDPVTERVENRLHSRKIAVCVVFLTALLAVLAAVLIVFPLLERQTVLFVKNVPAYAALIREKTAPVLERLNDRFPQQFDNIRESVSEYASTGLKVLGKAFRRLLSGGAALLNILSLLVITPVVALYFLLDWKKMNADVLALIPRSKELTVCALLSQINAIVSGFIRGQACVCLALGVFYALSLTIAGLDLGLLIGLCIGCICFIPYVGSLTGFIVSISLMTVQYHSWRRAALVVAIFLAGQALEGNFLTPKLIGDKIGLHPVWIMFALLAGASLFGFLGVLLAVPTAAVIGVLVRFAVGKYKESSLYLDTPAVKK